jgi:hypothetical protein
MHHDLYLQPTSTARQNAQEEESVAMAAMAALVAHC